MGIDRKAPWNSRRSCSFCSRCFLTAGAKHGEIQAPRSGNRRQSDGAGCDSAFAARGQDAEPGRGGQEGRLRQVAYGFLADRPCVYSTLFTSTKPEEHGVTGFLVGGITASTNMLKEEPIWSMLSKHGVMVGMANVPRTFPVTPVNSYMISGMLTRGKNCEDGVLCAPKLSEVEGGDPVYPAALKPELLENVGDFYVDL